MYLLYADDSGDLNDPNVGFFVVAGLAVHEAAIRPLAAEINNTLNEFVSKKLGKRLEIHGNPMRRGGDSWERVSEAKRQALVKKLLRHCCCEWTHGESESGPHPFLIVIDRGHSLSPSEAAYGELLHLFDAYLRSGRRKGYLHNGILVADRGRYQRALEAWVQIARARFPFPRQDYRRLYSLAETPFFVDSSPLGSYSLLTFWPIRSTGDSVRTIGNGPMR
ncbi:MAG: DUF3800 domain-containing protein [Actinomycetota bacterium]|nr:DUF3800 domain-containing protein [Actinomycetota bacterium]